MAETTGAKFQTFTIQGLDGTHITLAGYLVRQVEGVNVPPRDTAVGTEDELLAHLREEEQDARRNGKPIQAARLHAAVEEIVRLRAAAGPIFTIHNAPPKA